MNTLIGLVLLVFVIIWASRVETGINDITKSLKRIEKQLKKEK